VASGLLPCRTGTDGPVTESWPVADPDEEEHPIYDEIVKEVTDDE
jgi:hypothetical protein